MQKFARIINEETKQCDVGLGTNDTYYKRIGMSLMDVEQAYNGQWYLEGYAPEKPQEETKAERIQELKTKLAETDYVVIKIAEGSATREEYEEILEQRETWRDEINKLQEIK